MIWEAFASFGPIFLSFLQKNDPEGFVGKVRTIEADNLLPSYDFIIVGAGSAGSVVANRLSENSSWNVLLVEAGDQENHYSKTPAIFPALSSSPYNWNYTTVRQAKSCLGNDGICPYPRGRSLGGSSATNGMIFLRGYKTDYDRWGQDNPGWSFEDVRPFFLKSQDNRIEGLQDRGTDGQLTISHANYKSEIRESLMKAGEEIGLKNEECMNYENNCIEFVPMSVRDGRRCSASKAYLEPVAGERKHLHILTNAYVTKVVIEGNDATGIEISMGSGKSVRVRATREVILSAGAIDSPKVLMLSGIGPKEHLESLGIDVVMDLPVGSYLQDHGYTQIPFDVTHGTMNTEDLGNSMDEYVKSQTGPLSSNGFEVTAYSTLGQPGPPVNHYILGTTVDSPKKQLMLISGIMRPHSSGTVRLSTADPTENQLIDINFFSDQRDYEMQLAGLKEGLKLVQASAMKAFNPTPAPTEMCTDVKDVEKYLICLMAEQTEHGHPVGTVKMSPKDKGGVVDHHLRVYGVDHLRVIDASIAPYVVSVNTNSMAIMIGERGADIVKHDHAAKSLP